MALDRTDVEKIAHLARLAAEENELSDYVGDLSNILKLVEQMDAADTSNVKPMAHPLDMTQRLRDDAVTEQNQRDHFQEIAPQVQSGLYLVPKVIE